MVIGLPLFTMIFSSEIHVEKFEFYNFVEVSNKLVQDAVDALLVELFIVVGGMEIARRKAKTLEYHALTRWNKTMPVLYIDMLCVL